MAYPTTTHHPKVYPYTSIMASPYSCDPTGATNCAAAIEALKANQSSIGTIYIPHGTFKIATNLTIPSGMALLFEKGGSFAVSAGVTLTITGYILAGPFQIFSGAGTISINAVNLLQFGAWSGSTGITVAGTTTFTGTVNFSGAFTHAGAITFSALTPAGYVKNSVAGLLSTGSIAAGDLPTGIDALKIADGSITNTEFQCLNGVASNIQDQITGMSSGNIVQIVSTETGTYATGATQMVFDDTIPQITEGNEYMTLVITPTSLTNKLKIEVIWNGSSAVATASQHMVALFQDATANALAAVADYGASVNQIYNMKMTHVMTVNTIAATTFRVRAGNASAGATYFNGIGAVQRFNGVYASSIVITEYVP